MKNYLIYVPIFILLVGAISLYYNYWVNSRKPEIKIYASIPRPIFDSPKTPLQFNNGFSNELDLTISIWNTGKKTAKSILFQGIMNKEVEIISYPVHEGWKTSNQISEFSAYVYEADNKLWPKNVNRSIGKFKIRIPAKERYEDYIIFNGIIEGDFEKKCFLIIYNYENEIIEIPHYKGTKINIGNDIWNKRNRERK